MYRDALGTACLIAAALVPLLAGPAEGGPRSVPPPPAVLAALPTEASSPEPAKADPDSGEKQRAAAMAAYEQQDFTRAAPLLEAAREFFPTDVALLGRLGFAWKETGEYEKALEVLLEAAALDPENHQLWWWLSDTQRLLGRYEASQKSMQTACSLVPAEEAETYAQRLSFTEALMDGTRAWQNFETHRTLAKRHGGTHRIERCIAEYVTALRVAPEVPDGIEEGQLQLGWVHQELGIQYSYLKEFGVAIEYFRGAVHHYEQAGSLADTMRNCQNLARAYNAAADLGSAYRRELLETGLGYWERTLAIARELADVEYTRFAQGGLLANLAALYPVDDARVQEVREKNLLELPWRGPINEFTVAEVALGELACRLEEGDVAGARIVLEMALPFYEKSNFRSDRERAVELAVALAYIYCLQGHFEKALEVAEDGVEWLAGIRQFIDAAAFNRGAEGLLRRRLCAAQVRACIGLEAPEQALDYLEAFQAEAVQSLLGGVILNESTEAGRETEEELLRGRIPLLEAAVARSGADSAERTRLEKLLGRDRARLAWLERDITFEAPERLGYTAAPGKDASAIQAALPQDVTLLSYVFDKWGGAVLAVTPDEITAVSLEEAREDRVSELVQTFFDSVTNDVSAATASVEQLHGMLAAPVLAHLKAPVLCVAEGDLLDGLPFDALAAGGKALVDDHAVVHVPSGSHLAHYLAAEPAALERVRALLHRGGIESAPARALTTFPGDEATESRATQGVAEGDALHIVCEADFALDDVMLGALLLAGDEKNDGRLHAVEYLGASAPARFVFLDLSTVKADYGAATAAFAEALRHAGARALLVNQWTPKADCARALTSAFYENLGGMGVARALTEAKRAVRRANPGSFDWAAFVIHGDYR